MSGLAKRLGIPITVGSRLGRGSVFRLEFANVKNAHAEHAGDGLPLTTDLDMRGVVGVLEDNDIVRNAVSALFAVGVRPWSLRANLLRNSSAAWSLRRRTAIWCIAVGLQPR